MLSYKTKGPDDTILKAPSRRVYLFFFNILWLYKQLKNKEGPVEERQMKKPEGMWDLQNAQKF